MKCTTKREHQKVFVVADVAADFVVAAASVIAAAIVGFALHHEHQRLYRRSVES